MDEKLTKTLEQERPSSATFFHIIHIPHRKAIASLHSHTTWLNMMTNYSFWINVLKVINVLHKENGLDDSKQSKRNPLTEAVSWKFSSFEPNSQSFKKKETILKK